MEKKEEEIPEMPEHITDEYFIRARRNVELVERRVPDEND